MTAEPEIPVHDRRPIQETLAARLRTDAPMALLDGGIAYLVYLLSLVLRFDGEVPARYWERFRWFALAAIAVHLSANYAFGLYGRVWRYASIQEARRIVAASGIAGVLLFGGTIAAGRPLPTSVLVSGFILSLAGFGAVRFQSRLFALRRREVVPPKRKRVLVVGGGDLGAGIVRDMLADPSCGLYPVGIVDDDARKHGKIVHGIPVVGGLAGLGATIARRRAEQVLVALPGAPAERFRTLHDECEAAEVPMRVVPTLDEAIGGRPTIRDIRDLRIEDLIGRTLVETDLAAVDRLLRGRRVLITGAGGSIGSEIVRQVSGFDPEALILLEHDETHLHDLVTSLATDPSRVVTLLADVRDHARMLTLMSSARPDVVFHAAAHKHVPILEEHPEEAIKTNIIGTANAAEGALRAGAQRFILISTDKAIQPVSVMGMTKHIAEQVVRSLNDRGCLFSAVRFGNVLGSRGSVIPTFMRQIAHGGPVTVTDPDMTRYFMSISEAVGLVLQASTLAGGGEIFTLDMGEAVNIMQLARRMIRLSGRTPDRDIRIEITGVRPGERLNEPLVGPRELMGPSAHPNIFRSEPPELDPAHLRASILELTKLCDVAPADEIRTHLRALVAHERHLIDLTGERDRVVVVP